jgi:hypothetical protein
MIGFLERRIASVDQHLVLLAPAHTPLPHYFENVTVDRARHQRHLREMQRLRGGIYLRDGAVHAEELSSDDRHETPEDANSWHLLMFKEGRRLSSCVWYMEHENTAHIDQLRVRNCPLRLVSRWRDTLSRAVALELAHARRERLHYAEVGGWAVATESRCTWEGLLLALAAYSLGRIFGGSLGITNATTRHSSSTILKRIGGSPLEAEGLTLPSYFDPKYACEMELLRFDSRRPNPKFALLIELLRHKLASVEVVSGNAGATTVAARAAVNPGLVAACA